MIISMHLNIKDHQLTIVIYKYKLLYMDLLITTNQNPIIDTHTQREKGIQI